MEDDTIPAEIAMTAIDCKEFFDTQAPTDHEWIRSAQFEFNYWFNTFIATQFDKSGLDYLLRHYPDKRENICDLIDALKSAVEGAMHIYNGTEFEDDILKDDMWEESIIYAVQKLMEYNVNRHALEGEWEDPGSAQESEELETSSITSEAPPNEEPEIVEDDVLSISSPISTTDADVKQFIDNARTIQSLLISRSRNIWGDNAKYRFERADKALKETEEVKAFRRHLTAIINSGFPDKDAEGLPATEMMKRAYDDAKFSPVKLKLIRANILRKHRIEYFTQSQASRSHVPVEVADEIQIQKPDKTPAAIGNVPSTSAVSSKEKESQPVTSIAPPQVHEAPVEMSRSIYNAAVTASDVDSDCDTADLSANTTPPKITMVTKIGGLQAYPRPPEPQPDGTLICPYCNDKLPDSYAKNEQSWRAHVDYDILPYSCIMEECSNNDEMYPDARQLLLHMKEKHSSKKWHCNPCVRKAWQTSESDQSDSQAGIYFDSAKSWLVHTEREHGDLCTDFVRGLLTRWHECDVIGPQVCPLCESKPTEQSTVIDKHILKHLLEFALRALPGNAMPANEKET